jgi:hypothetical protein
MRLDHTGSCEFSAAKAVEDNGHSYRLLKSEPFKAIYSLGDPERGFL